MAQKSKVRHQVVETFLLALGISPATARIDAEGIEHHVSDETLEALAEFIRRSGGKFQRALPCGIAQAAPVVEL